MKNADEKLTPKAEQARQTLKVLTGRKTHHSLDTEFGAVTVEDVPTQPAPPAAKAASKRRR